MRVLLVLVGISFVECQQPKARTQPPPGCITVGKSAQYKTLDSAVKDLGSGSKQACIFVHCGNYTEQAIISYKGPLTIYGSTTETGSYKLNTVTFMHKLSSPDAGSLDKSATINIISGNLRMYNINVRNTYGKGHQAVAYVICRMKRPA
jgi:pectinesterase